MSDEMDGLARLTGYLRALLSSGQPLPEGLARLAGTLASKRERELLEAISADLATGAPLSAAVAAQLGRDTPPLLTTLLKAGETSGRLRESVDALAAYYETQRELGRQISAALLYPRVALMVVIAVVLPTLAWVQSQIGAEPGFGESAMSSPFSRLLGFVTGVALWPFTQGPLVTGGLITFAALVLFGGLPPLDRLVARLTRRLFAAGGVRRAGLAASLSRGLGLLLGAGVPAPEALRLLQGCSAEPDARRELAAAADRAETGLPLGQVLASVPVLPPTLAWFLNPGPGAALETGLAEAARFYEDEARDRAQLVANSIQPIIMLALATAFLPSLAMMIRMLSVFSMAGALR